MERLGIPKIMVSDGPHGLRAQPGEGDHVGIGGSVPATCFPTASAVASAWNPDLLTRIGAGAGPGGPRLQPVGDPRPGHQHEALAAVRTEFEYFSEDPFLAGELARRHRRRHQAGGVGTSVKHYAANNQETDRLRVDAQIDERTLREIYLPAFERVVTARGRGRSCAAYNKVNGQSARRTPGCSPRCCAKSSDSKVWSSRTGVRSTTGCPALLAGLDLEMPPALGREPGGGGRGGGGR